MEKQLRRIYVAGSYSAPNVVEVLNNMRRGMRKSVEVLLAGYAPFCPWLDYQFNLMLQEGEELILEHFYNYSLAWLEVSDAILVLPNSEKSKGTQAEIERANEIGIPVFHSLEDLQNFTAEVENEQLIVPV